MRKLLTSDLLPLVYNYFRSIGLKSFAEKLNKMSGMELDMSESPLASKKLAKIVKFYIKNNEKLLEHFQEKEFEVEEEEEEEEEEVVEEQPKKSKKNKDKKKKKQQQVESEEEEEEQQEKVSKKSNKRKNKKVQEVEEEEDKEQDSEEVKEQIVKKTKQSNKTEEVEKNVNGEQQQDEEEEELGTGAKFFQRCDESRMNQLKQSLKDNTFEAKLKFGNGGDEHGKIGWEKLRDKRGKDFKKEKGKLKNKAFCGGVHDPFALNGIKL